MARPQPVTTSLSASVIGLFQGTIQTMALAAALMTIVAAQGGNAGVQTLTVMVRGLALGQVSRRARARASCSRSWRSACGNGDGAGPGRGRGRLTCCTGRRSWPSCSDRAGGELSWWPRSSASLIPLALRWLRADPAVASSVFVTACTDHVRVPRLPRPAVARLTAISRRDGLVLGFGLGTRPRTFGSFRMIFRPLTRRDTIV